MSSQVRHEPSEQIIEPPAQTAPHQMHPKYRPDIDGLRALAVLSVFAYHVAPGYGRGGFIGVDIFFVISGFLISSIIFGNLEKGTWSYRQFYNRRIRRILPSLIVVLAVCLIFSLYALLPDQLEQLGKHVAGGAGFLSNFLLWHESGYFDTSAQSKPLLHLWSLGIEEQFYVIWPLLITFAWKKRWNLLLVIGLMAVASFAVNLFETSVNQVAAFYSPLSRIWELAIGAMLAHVALNRPTVLPLRNPIAANLSSIAGVAMIVAGLLGIARDSAFPGWLALLPTAGTLLVIAAGPSALLNKVLFANPVAVGIGLISYPLYLWHWPLLSFGKVIGGVTSATVRLGLASIAFPLAWLTYKIVEKPIRFGGRGSFKANALLVCALVLAVGGWTVWRLDGLPSRPSVRNSTFDSRVEALFTGPAWQYTDNRNCRERFPFPEASRYPWWFCMLSKDQNPTLVVLGNSYANHLYPGLISNPALRQHTVLSIGVCGPLWVDSIRVRKYSWQDPCSGQRPVHQLHFINELVRRAGTARFVIFDGLPFKPSRYDIDAIRKRVEFFAAQHVRTIIFVPHVAPGYDTRDCFSRPMRAKTRSCVVDARFHANVLRNFSPLLRELSTTDPDVLVFDQNDAFCDNVKCTFLKDGLPLFRDEYHHYSELGSAVVIARFVEWAKHNAPQVLAP